ncbi:MAG: cation diffusion facilitator family transporter [Terriglobales bacterium]|jgi:cation diffusion facilitator family transporter
MQIGKRIALTSILVSALLAVGKIVVGSLASSTSVVADGLESAGDVIASGFVLLGFIIAARPASKKHPYGHGRYETLTGLFVGIILFLGGIGICYRSLQHVGSIHSKPAAYGLIPLLISLIAKAVLSIVKFRFGRRIHSASIIADAWNDFADIISAGAAMAALGLTLWDPGRFLAADHYGGVAVGLIVVFIGIRVAKDTSSRLADAMPGPDLLDQIRQVALSVPGTTGVEKLFARNTGLQYHVDLHLEVDPEMTVRQAHDIAHEVRFAIRRQLNWVADVLVHVEPAPGPPAFQPKQ